MKLLTSFVNNLVLTLVLAGLLLIPVIAINMSKPMVSSDVLAAQSKRETIKALSATSTAKRKTYKSRYVKPYKPQSIFQVED
jgi:hypothetical protein